MSILPQRNTHFSVVDIIQPELHATGHSANSSNMSFYLLLKPIWLLQYIEEIEISKGQGSWIVSHVIRRQKQFTDSTLPLNDVETHKTLVNTVA